MMSILLPCEAFDLSSFITQDIQQSVYLGKLFIVSTSFSVYSRWRIQLEKNALN